MRSTERRASWPTWVRRPPLKRSDRLHFLAAGLAAVRLLAGALERAPGLGEEDVVERGLVKLQLLDRDPGRVERPDHVGELRLAALQPHREAAAPGRLAALAERAQRLRGAILVGRVARHRLDRRPADLRLQLRRRPLGDDRAVVDDPDPVGERVGLLQVLGREEDRDALLGGSRATSSQRAVRLWMSSPVVGSSRKRMLGRWASASARSSRRFIPPE